MPYLRIPWTNPSVYISAMTSAAYLPGGYTYAAMPAAAGQLQTGLPAAYAAAAGPTVSQQAATAGAGADGRLQ